MARYFVSFRLTLRGMSNDPKTDPRPPLCTLKRGDTQSSGCSTAVALPQGRVFLYVPYSLPRVRQEPRNFLFPEV